ncbi:hypothetical protein BH10BAC2_BH10BAC2_26200 [soil metagenome]
MKSLVAILLTIFLISFANAQTKNNNAFELKAFVVREGSHTMTKEEFLKYGKVELNSPKLKVSSFVLFGEGELNYHKVDGNTFSSDNWTKELISKIKSENYTIVVEEISFVSATGMLRMLTKNLQIVLKR